jgi:hypothetical protein
VTEFPDHLPTRSPPASRGTPPRTPPAPSCIGGSGADPAELGQLIRVVELAEAEYRDMTAGEGDP